MSAARPKFDQEVPEGAEVIVPISMGEYSRDKTCAQSGPRLRSLIEYLQAKQCKITVLVADYLQRHNVGEEKALAMGDKFINDNKDLFNEKQIVPVRWKEYLATHEADLQAPQKTIEVSSAPIDGHDSPFMIAIKQTANKTPHVKDIKSSIAYQKEEYAVILQMKGFLVYPKTSIALEYLLTSEEFKSFKKPTFSHHPYDVTKKTPKKNLRKLTQKEKPQIQMDIATRLAMEHLQNILRSEEVRDDSKTALVQKAVSACVNHATGSHNLILIHQLLRDICATLVISKTPLPNELATSVHALLLSLETLASKPLPQVVRAGGAAKEEEKEGKERKQGPGSLTHSVTFTTNRATSPCAFAASQEAANQQMPGAQQQRPGATAPG